ncbi:MAG: NifU family protein [Candidatus Eisenbacteria bacterium]|uniref:NifU family protein n=1 Tax=Eiseniibacteriota bacterium TaxID=2212470 RepID=A0A538TS34_UNCEI|nr:MAG: NifU family protein [Candidatus Eisenbacteria bacterium]
MELVDVSEDGVVTLRLRGSDIELVDVSEDGVVTLRLRGSCTGCGSAAMTLRNGVERWIRSKVPGVREIVTTE